MRHHQTTPARLALGCALLAAALATAASAASSPQAPPPSAKTAAKGPAVPSGLDPILKELSTWNSGVESAAVWKLRDYVYARKDDAAGRAECEAKLLAFLKAPVTLPAKITASRYLRVIASDTAVPALQALLPDERSFDAALYVLQQIPGAAADKALLQALTTAVGPAKVSIIAALGQRGTPDAVALLAPMLKQGALAAPAATALGAIGGDTASQALAAALPSAAGDLRPVVAASMMKCAERALAARNDAAALAIYQQLSADTGLPAPVRKGAALGRISAAGAGAPAVLMELLSSADPGLQQAAVGKVKDVVRPEAIGQICAVLPRLPEAARVQLLAVLSGYPRERVLPSVLEAARSESITVRIAAMKALESVGDVSAVSVLVDTAVKTKGPEQAAARSALGLLKGRAVDERILALVAQKPSDEVQGELLQAIADRRIFVGKPVVAAALASPSGSVRVQALRSLRSIGTPSDIAGVLDVLLKCADDYERTEAESTVAALAQKTTNQDARANQVRMRLAMATDPAVRVQLIGLLPRIGDSSTLPLLRAGLNDTNAAVYDAAVRAITSWPTSAARDDVFRLARDTRNETHRLLAIRALVRTITIDKHRDPVAAVADLRSAAAFAWRPEEQKLVLGALAQFPCRDALDLANGFLREPEVKAEAEAAIKQISGKMK